MNCAGVHSSTKTRSVLVSDQAPVSAGEAYRSTCSQRSFKPVKQPQNLATDPAVKNYAAAATEALSPRCKPRGKTAHTMAKMLRRQPSFLEWASFDAHPLFVATCDNVPAPKLELLLIIAKDECGQVGGLNCFLRYLQTKHWCKARWFGLRSMECFAHAAG